MQIHQLRYFCAVARTGSFTRAAEQEHLAQPSLSQQVRKLEDELGTRLFDRLGRSVRLTSFGETFLPRAEAILRQVEDAKHEIEEMAGVERGKVVVGSIPTVAPYFLPGCLASFSRKFPDIQVSVVEELTSELLERVQDGTLDLALLALKQVERDPFLLLKDGHCFRENTLSACGRARLRPNVVFESGQFTTILAMVGGGTGVSVVPQMAVERRKGCRFIPIADEGAYRRVGIVQLKQHFRSRAHTTFLEHLQQSVAGMS